MDEGRRSLDNKTCGHLQKTRYGSRRLGFKKKRRTTADRQTGLGTVRSRQLKKQKNNSKKKKKKKTQKKKTKNKNPHVW